MRNRLIVLFAVAAGLWLAVPARAHHTASTLYAEKTVTLKGTVKTWLWSNPHCLLTFDVKGDDGQVVQWLAESQAPNTAYTEGYRANIFKPGDEVTVTVRPAATGRPFGLLAQVVLPDGRKVGNLRGEGERGGAAPQ
jgi:hypothetical protein